MSQDPMDLSELPQYLKSIKENGETGPAPLVGMGQIIAPPPKKSSWGKVILATLICATVGLGGVITYEVTSPQRPTIVNIEGSNDSSPAGVPQVVPNDNPIVAKEDKKKRGFLWWLFGE